MKLGEPIDTWKLLMATCNLSEYETGIPLRFGDVSLADASLRLEGGAILFRQVRVLSMSFRIEVSECFDYCMCSDWFFPFFPAKPDFRSL